MFIIHKCGYSKVSVSYLFRFNLGSSVLRIVFKQRNMYIKKKKHSNLHVQSCSKLKGIPTKLLIYTKQIAI